MNKKLNKKVLIDLIVLALISGDLLRTFYLLIFNFGCLTYFGLIVLIIELVIGGICYEELETRVRRISL